MQSRSNHRKSPHKICGGRGTIAYTIEIEPPLKWSHKVCGGRETIAYTIEIEPPEIASDEKFAGDDNLPRQSRSNHPADPEK